LFVERFLKVFLKFLKGLHNFVVSFMKDRKIILFGGTFDPIHIGHTSVAAFAADKIKAEKIIFIPAKRSPLKNLLPKAADDDRLAMIALAIGGNKKFELSSFELQKSTPSYTIDTVRYFKKTYGQGVEICWLVGADSLDDLPYWYKITELIDECSLYVMCRAGYKEPDFTKFIEQWGSQRIEKLRRDTIQTPLIDISSTEIRKRLAEGKDVLKMLHPAVADYIAEHGLYK
jgi:nicotinate-nucleotide adenylyltransferase